MTGSPGDGLHFAHSFASTSRLTKSCNGYRWQFDPRNSLNSSLLSRSIRVAESLRAVVSRDDCCGVASGQFAIFPLGRRAVVLPRGMAGVM